jgi:hypothetical protein
MHILFFIGVAKDDDVAVTRRPKKPAVEVAEESLGELLILRGVREVIFLLRKKINHWDALGGPAMLTHWSGQPA